jgi:hypothetical protein
VMSISIAFVSFVITISLAPTALPYVKKNS